MGAGRSVEAVLLHRFQIAQADLGPLGDVAQADLAHLALAAEPVAERAGLRLPLLLPGRLAAGALLGAASSACVSLGQDGAVGISVLRGGISVVWTRLLARES